MNLNIMNDKTIKNLLTDNLVKINSNDFNQKIISKLKEKQKSKNSSVFKTIDIVIASILSLLLYVVLKYNLVINVDQTTLQLSVLLCLIPIYYIVFNKIHQLTINQKTE